MSYHYIPVLSHYLPESCFLILLGILLATVGWFADPEADYLPTFTAELFFNVLLPPIILDAAFTLYDRDFLSNLR